MSKSGDCFIIQKYAKVFNHDVSIGIFIVLGVFEGRGEGSGWMSGYVLVKNVS